MGNYASSCFQISLSKPKTAKLMDFHGNLKEIKLPVKAAELMIEQPGFVLSPLHDLRRTGRVVALRAEDDLLPAHIYLFLPFSRVNNKISESEMVIVLSAAAVGVKMSRKRHRGATILPTTEVQVEGETQVEVLEQDAGFSRCRLEKYGHWTPVLDPISEELEP